MAMLCLLGCGGERFTSHDLYRGDTLSWRLAEAGDYRQTQQVILPLLEGRSYLTSMYDSSEYAILFSRLAFAAFKDSARTLEQSFDLSGRDYYHHLGDTLRAETLRWAGQAALAGGDAGAAWSYFSESYHLARRLGIETEAEKTWECWQGLETSVGGAPLGGLPLTGMGVLLMAGILLGLAMSTILWRSKIASLTRWISDSRR